ncbi:MAG: SDR family NAD(P)-dependent oxidoreductase [Lactobacillus sp.]|jgi:NAD(P)-dependent dehydrogenase (short-subunit alcohol dehydrogenase family)|nr:SDR family NAD(P)-dependent oxidoreductase [Lactobacillus sp.]
MKKFYKKAQAPKGVQPYWGLKDIPDLTNKVFVITGATQTQGRLITEAIYANNGTVILADSHRQSAYDLIQKLRTQVVSRGILQYRQLDLNSPASIQSFAIDLQNEVVQLDGLINSSGITRTSRREENGDGIEAHFQENFLGHFMLTNLLIPLLQMAPDPRIVNISAPLPIFANIKFNDLQLEHAYSNSRAYFQSKLAVQMATFYLQSISHAQGLGLKVMTTHSGISKKSLLSTPASAIVAIQALANPLLGSVHTGILPTLFAATDPHAQGGKLYAPNGLLHLQGRPKITRPIAKALDEDAQSQLWVAASELAGFSSWAAMAHSF